MHLEVYLGTQGQFFTIHLYDNTFVRKWTEELSWCLGNCEFNDTEAFAALWSIEHAADKLTAACATINHYLKDFIEIKKPIQAQDQNYFNYLHGIFEKINGGFDRPTRLWTVAPPDLRKAVRDLNFFIHRVEKREHKKYQLYISFNKDQYRRLPLEPEDYNFFEFDFSPGTLFLHYAEVGKEFVDLYEDDLPITYGNFRNLHYYSGEAWLSMESRAFSNKPGFFDWIRAQGFDPWDRTLGHGRIPLGYVEDIQQVSLMLDKHRHLDKILIKD